MASLRTRLQQHLERLLAAHGADQPLPVARRATRPGAAPTVRAATPRPAAPARPGAVASAPPPARPRGAVPADSNPAPLPLPTGLQATSAPAGTGHPEVATALAELRAEVLQCQRCRLSEGRQHVVFGEGNPATRVLFIGEAPGATEDRTGRPFVGEAGQLLNRILKGAMGLERSDVYIANINKCRPPNNRAPQPDEVAQCLPFLKQQVALLRPEVIVCLGRVAAQNLLGRTESASKLRGLDLAYEGIPVVVTWHPAYLLREPSKKRETWDDIKRVNRLLGLPEVPPPAP